MSPPRVAQVSVGDELPGRTVHVDRARLVQYAGASLDRNPIHWDERFARSVGLPDVIAHGMLTMGAALGVVADWAGGPERVVRCSSKFPHPVVVPHGEGADIEVSAQVTALDEATRRATVEVRATCRGAKVLGRALAVVQLD